MLIRARLVELICPKCHTLIVVGENKGFVDLAEVNEAEHDHQLWHLIQQHKEAEAML